MTRFELASVPDHVAAAAKAAGIAPWTLAMHRPLPEPVAPSAPVVVASDLTNEEWALLRPYFGTNEKRKNKAPARRYLDGALYQRTTRCRFVHIPKRYGNVQALRKHLERWAHTGVWASVLEVLEADGLQELGPERRRVLLGLARAWSQRGEAYQRQRA
ncbi:MAG: transposase [Xanthobacteraceae bacterium]|jgi:transposase|nr:transposase [Xanthobacteraceae bacterium]